MKTIFVVDDDADDLEVFCEAVREIDGSIKCIECADPEMARTLIRSMIVPNIAFIDINMPKYSGFELLGDIRAESSLNKLPIAMLSTSMDEKAQSRLRLMGAQFVLAKPPTFPEYVEMLKPILSNI